MSDDQKPVEAPKEAPATETPAEVKPTEETKAEDKPAEAEAPAAAEASTDAAAAEEEVTPVEEGKLEHKSAEAKLPKNFLYAKENFWFGSDAVETDKLSGYIKTAKNTDVAQQNAAWAASTGKGLLFVGSKEAPTGIINLGEAGEVTTDGPTKFHFTASGFKHTFKASSKADAGNWVSQLKLKIEEATAAKEAVTASDAYTAAMEGFKPAKKEETPAEPAKEEAKTGEEAPAVEEAKEEAKEEEPAKEEVKSEEEATKEPEEPKRRSASRKRDSMMNFNFFKKEKKESKTEDKPAETAETAAAAETPAEASTEAPPATEEPAAEPAAATEETKTDDAPKEKPSVQKRASIFSGVFGKKEKKVEEPAKEETAEAEAPASSETAPVIPPVETTTPLDTGISNAATVPTETKEVAPATNGESKKEAKSEKRKSSLPFFGSKEKAEKSDGEEKMGPFSKIRATIRGRTKGAAEKTEEKAAEKSEDKPTEAEAAEAPKEEAPKPAEEEPVNKPEPAVATAPVVTATA